MGLLLFFFFLMEGVHFKISSENVGRSIFTTGKIEMVSGCQCFPINCKETAGSNDQQIPSASWHVLEVKGVCKSLPVLFTVSILKCCPLHEAVKRKH